MASATHPLHVVAGVIRDREAKILLSLRLPHQEQGGLWEFPGGKVQSGETRISALRRELREELGIEVDSALPLIKVLHSYPERTVILDVWEVERWRGSPDGREGQSLSWVGVSELATRQFPAANLPIITAVQLPRTYLITPEPDDLSEFWSALEASLNRGIRLVQLRVKRPTARIEPIARAAVKLCEQHGAKLLINSHVELAKVVNAHGVHLTSAQLATLSSRPLPRGYYVGASTHTAAELETATLLGADFAVFGPVAATASHCGILGVGWQRVEEIVASSRIPIFALGGQNLYTVQSAIDAGCHGIAAIRGIWDSAERFADDVLRQRFAVAN